MTKFKRCACVHGRKRCLLAKHDGHAEPHMVLATAKEKRLGHHQNGFFYWNTGRIWPVLKAATAPKGRVQIGRRLVRSDCAANDCHDEDCDVCHLHDMPADEHGHCEDCAALSAGKGPA